MTTYFDDADLNRFGSVGDHAKEHWKRFMAYYGGAFEAGALSKREKLLAMEAELGKSAWFAGDQFSAADIQMSFPLEAAAQRGGLNWDKYPRLSGVLKLMHARPAYHRALEVGGPYSFAT